MSIQQISKLDNHKLDLWKQTKDKPLCIIGYDGCGKSYVANELLKNYHSVSIHSDHIKYSGDICSYITDTLYKQDIFMMLSSDIKYKSLLIDDLQLFSKYDKSGLIKLYNLVKTIDTTNHPIILVCNQITDKTITLLQNISYVIEIKFNLSVYKSIVQKHKVKLTKSSITYILQSNKNLHTILSTVKNFKYSDKDNSYTLDTTIHKVLFDDYDINELIRLCSCEYSILSLNIIENLPSIINKLDSSILYNIYKSICLDDYIEYKYMYLNLPIDLKIFYACVIPIVYSKDKLVPTNNKLKYNSYISKSIIQIHNQSILRGETLDYLDILQNLYDYKLNKHIDSKKLKQRLTDISFVQKTLEKQIKVFNYYYHKAFTKKQVIKILKEVYESY